MVHLEGWLQIQELHRLGTSQIEITRQLDLHRKRVRKYFRTSPGRYRPRRPRPAKLGPDEELTAQIPEKLDH